MRFRALDSIRGIAATIVALVHLTAAGFFYDIPVIRNGGLSVPLFFVLSGFVMSASYGTRLTRSEDLRTFFIRRFGRVYPIHFVMLTALLVLEILKLVMVKNGIESGQPPFSASNSVSSLIAGYLLLQSIIPFGDYTWNGPSWSLSVEFYTYGIFAAIVFFGSTRSKVATWLLWLISGILLLWLEVSGTHIHMTSGRGLLLCIFGFMSGVLLHSLFIKYQEILSAFSTLLEFAAFFLALTVFWFDPLGDVGTILAFSVIIFIFAGDRGKISALLHTFPLQFLGQISLSIYLTHFVILSVLNGAIRAAQSTFKIPLMTNVNMIDFGPSGSMDLLAVVYLVVVIAVSTCTFILIEEPFRLYFNSVSKRLPARYSLRAGIAEIRRLRAEARPLESSFARSDRQQPQSVNNDA